MPSVKATLNTRYQSKDKTYPIIIQVRHQGRKKHINIGESILKGSWNGHHVKDTHPDYERINDLIDSELARVKQYFTQCRVNGKPIVLEQLDEKKYTGFITYLERRAQEYYNSGKIIMRRKVNRFAKELWECFGYDLPFEAIDAHVVRKIDAYLIGLPNKANTRRKKMQFYAQFYGEVIHGKNPFNDDIHIMPEPVKKEKLTAEEVDKLAAVELTNKNVRDARNLFLFSFYCKGARFENCITMPRHALQGGRIEFRTNKGKKHISTLIHPRLRAILDQYGEGYFIFPFIKEREQAEILAYWAKDEDKALKDRYIKIIDAHNTKCNKWLKKACKAAGIKRVTFHEARHTFAHLLKKSNASIHAIKESLGHSTTRQTEDYLKDLDNEQVDSEVAKLYGA